MSKIKGIGLAAFLTVSAIATAVDAHAHLTGAEPKAEAHLSASPKLIRATFSESLMVAFSTLALTTDKGEAVATGKAALAPGDNHTLVSPLLAPLPPGRYVVHWRAVSADTHKTAGEYGFSVGP